MKPMTAASLSFASYESPRYDPDGSRENVSTTEGSFVEFSTVSTASGYQGTLFQNILTGELILAHRGTEFDREALKDGLVDLGMVTTKANAQRADALAFTRTAMEIAKQEQRSLHVTGHSLGGTLAQITAHHYNLPGMAFNPYGAAGLGYRIGEGQSPHAAHFINHVMAGDVVSAASPHYGSVEVYARPHELEALRKVEQHASQLQLSTTPLQRIAVTTGLAVALGDSHRLTHFLDQPQQRSVLDDPNARITDPDDLRRVNANRANAGQIRTGISRVLRGGPGVLKDAVAELRGTEPPGMHWQRLGELQEKLQRSFNPALTRHTAPAHDGSPAPDAISFHTHSALQRRLDTLLKADDESFLRLNHDLAQGPAAQRLEQRTNEQIDHEELLQQAKAEVEQRPLIPPAEPKHLPHRALSR